MIHPGCGHLIMPHEASTAPPAIQECETPNECLRCRGDGQVGEILKFATERLEAQERALRGMRTHLPTVFGRSTATSVENIDERIQELRKGINGVYERTWVEFAQMERRERW